MSAIRRWRPALLKVHRWIAWSAGLVLMLNAFTGLTLLGGRYVDEWLNPQLFKVHPAGATLPLESVRQAMRAEFAGQNLSILPGREPGDAMVVSVRGDKGWEGHVFLDPYTGARLGARDRFGFNLDGLFELHSSMLSGKNGKGVLGFVALCMFVMLATGLCMWWPVRWRHAFTVAWTGARPRTMFDLHRVAGATLGLWVMVCVASGGLLAYRPASQWINQLTGTPTRKAAPAVPKDARAKAQAPRPTLDALLQTADRAMPGGETNVIVLPAAGGEPVKVRKKMPDDPHPVGLSSVWVEPSTGAVLRVDRWKELPPGERMFAWIYPLHSGQLAGAIGVVITAVGGMALLGFGVTGTWLWWLRRGQRAAATATSTAGRKVAP